MKKSISMMSLTLMVLMLSCERNDNYTAEDDMPVAKSRMTKDDSHTLTSKTAENDLNEDSQESDTGDDEGPRRDKQHWRIKNDSIK